MLIFQSIHRSQPALTASEQPGAWRCPSALGQAPHDHEHAHAQLPELTLSSIKIWTATDCMFMQFFSWSRALFILFMLTLKTTHIYQPVLARLVSSSLLVLLLLASLPPHRQNHASVCHDIIHTKDARVHSHAIDFIVKDDTHFFMVQTATMYTSQQAPDLACLLLHAPHHQMHAFCISTFKNRKVTHVSTIWHCMRLDPSVALSIELQNAFAHPQHHHTSLHLLTLRLCDRCGSRRFGFLLLLNIHTWTSKKGSQCNIN